MKTITGIVVTMVLFVTLLAGSVSADTLQLLCRVDIGDPASEAGHNLAGWGPVEPSAAHWYDGVPWAGMAMAPTENARAVWGYVENTRCATLTLDRCINDGTATTIRFRHLDGLYLLWGSIADTADDSFTVKVKDNGELDSEYQTVFVYEAQKLKQWVESSIDLTGNDIYGNPVDLNLDGWIDVQICATGPRWYFFGCDLGQVVFDWIELYGETPSEPGGEGFTPGYWKNHLGSWAATGYSPDATFFAVFGVGPNKTTLLKVLKTGGGGEKALGRHATAALLNAAHPDVDYEFSPAQVIAMVQEAYATGNFEGIKDIFEGYNELEGDINS